MWGQFFLGIFQNNFEGGGQNATMLSICDTILSMGRQQAKPFFVVCVDCVWYIVQVPNKIKFFGFYACLNMFQWVWMCSDIFRFFFVMTKALIGPKFCEPSLS